MTAILSEGYFSDASRKNAEAKQAQDDMLEVLREMMGGNAETELTVSSNSITIPNSNGGQHTVDTQSDGATDELDNILYDNAPDGRWLLLSGEDAARITTINDSAGGNGQIILRDSSTFQLTPSTWILLRRIGTTWKELTSSSVLVVKDTNPKLGGNLDSNDNSLVTLANKDFKIVPNGTGVVSVAGTTDYEDNLTHDDDIPNKKYVDDASGGDWTEFTTNTSTGVNSVSFSPGAGARQIKFFIEASATTNDRFEFVIGDSGGLETTNYLSGATNADGSGHTTGTYTDAFSTSAAGGSNLMYFEVSLTLLDEDTNLWLFKSKGHDTTNGRERNGTGRKALSGPITRVDVQLHAGENFATNNGIGGMYR